MTSVKGTSPSVPPTRASRLDRVLKIFTEVEPGEGGMGLLMALNVMLILVAYYMIKPLRDGWISIENLPGLTKMEVKAYSSYGQSMFLLWIVVYYDRMVNKLTRNQLISRSTLFCVANLILFWLLQPNLFFAPIPGLGVVFYLWVGIFGVFMVAQIWAFVVDLYNNERGRRLLPMIAIGGTLGAVIGSWLVQLLIKVPFLGSRSLVLLAIIPLLITWFISNIAGKKYQRTGPGCAPNSRYVVPCQGKTFELVLQNRFLLAVAIITLLLNWVNSNGENLLFRIVTKFLEDDITASGVFAPEAKAHLLKEGMVAFYGQFYFWVNVVALVLQSLVASRLLKYGGFAVLIFLLPLFALTSSITLALIPILSVIKVMKILENATDYSLNNTARHVLWLPMSLEVKFKAKTTIDSLFARLGDGMAAVTVLIGVNVFALSIQYYFVLNAVLVLIWLVGTIFVVRGHDRLTA